MRNIHKTDDNEKQDKRTKIQKKRNPNHKRFLVGVGTHNLTRNDNRRIWQKGTAMKLLHRIRVFHGHSTTPKNIYHSRGKFFLREADTKRDIQTTFERTMRIKRRFQFYQHYSGKKRFQNLLLQQQTRYKGTINLTKNKSSWKWLWIESGKIPTEKHMVKKLSRATKLKK